MNVTRVGDFALVWGESLRWDERRQRLYFVDCGRQTLHWLDGGEPPLATLPLPSMAAGIVLAEDGRLVGALDDGLHVIDPDAGTSALLAAYPPELGGRANDAHADGAGNLVTGTLNVAEGPGSYWWYSAREGWRFLDDGISNCNGPCVMGSTLVIADTGASALYAYDYDPAGAVAGRRVFADISQLGGMPDGACADADGGVWSCILGPGKVARYTAAGLDRVVEPGVELPSDVTFGGPKLDRMYVVSIAVDVGPAPITSPLAGALLRLDGTGARGRVEPRFALQA